MLNSVVAVFLPLDSDVPVRDKAIGLVITWLTAGVLRLRRLEEAVTETKENKTILYFQRLKLNLKEALKLIE